MIKHQTDWGYLFFRQTHLQAMTTTCHCLHGSILYNSMHIKIITNSSQVVFFSDLTWPHGTHPSATPRKSILLQISLGCHIWMQKLIILRNKFLIIVLESLFHVRLGKTSWAQVLQLNLVICFAGWYLSCNSYHSRKTFNNIPAQELSEDATKLLQMMRLYS